MDYENILKAMDILIDKKLEKNARYDQTVLATVIDDSERLAGQYVVKSDIAKFTAIKQANDTNLYSKGNKLYVMIPQGDYTNDKIILGKALMSNTEADLVYKTPIEQLYNLVPTNRMRIGSSGLYRLSYNTNKIQMGSWHDSDHTICSSFFDTFGFSVIVKTTGILPEDQIDYGIRFKITYTDSFASEELKFSAQHDMIGNVYHYILPYEQSVIFSNMQNRCIQSIFAEAYWEVLDDTMQIDDKNWTIELSDLKFYNGFYLGNLKKDFITVYSLGDKYYRSSNEKKEIYLLWLKYNETNGILERYINLPAPYHTTWKTSIVPLTTAATQDNSNYWLTLFNKTSDISQIIPMTANASITQVQVILETSMAIQNTFILEYVNYFAQTNTNNAKKLYFKFEDNLNGYYELYAANNQLINPDEALVLRTVSVVLQDNTPISEDAYVTWDYAQNKEEENPVSMISIKNEYTGFEPALDYTILPSYTTGLDNTIKCTIINNGEVYYGSIELRFGVPVWQSEPCTLEVTGMKPLSTASTRRACDPPSLLSQTKIRLYASIYDSKHTNQTFRVLNDIKWEIVNSLGGNSLKIQPEQKSSDADRSSFYCDVIIYTDYSDGAMADTYLKVTAQWPYGPDGEQSIITYVPFTYCNDSDYSALVGPQYLSWPNPPSKISYTLQNSYYKTNEKPDLKLELYGLNGYSIDEINTNEINIESTADHPETENDILVLGIIANNVWRQPLLLFNNRTLVGESKISSTIANTYSNFSNNEQNLIASLQAQIDALQEQINQLKS